MSSTPISVALSDLESGRDLAEQIEQVISGPYSAGSGVPARCSSPVTCDQLLGKPAALQQLSWPALVLHKSEILLCSLCQHSAWQTLQAFGRGGLGVILVTGVPGVEQKRERLLPLASAVQALPAAERQKLESPESRFNFGYSCGRETLEGGQPDTYKASYYGAAAAACHPAAAAGLLSTVCLQPTPRGTT